MVFGLIAGTTLAAPGGNGKVVTGACAVDGTTVHGWSLPDWELMNFMVTDTSGTTGWVIGFTDNGERWISVPARSGPTRYEFTGRTYGKDGKKCDVYASCTAG